MKTSSRRDKIAFIILIVWSVFAAIFAAKFRRDYRDENATINQMEMALEAAHAGRWVWDIENNSLFWDARNMELFGVSPETFVASYDGFLKRIHPDDRIRIDEHVRQTVKSRGQYTATFRAGDQARWIEIRAYGGVSPDGKSMAGICIPVHR